jgi:hypothetical protein
MFAWIESATFSGFRVCCIHIYHFCYFRPIFHSGSLLSNIHNQNQNVGPKTENAFPSKDLESKTDFWNDT